MTPPPKFQDAAHPHMRQPAPQTANAEAPLQGAEAPKDAAPQKVVCFVEAEAPFKTPMSRVRMRLPRGLLSI